MARTLAVILVALVCLSITIHGTPSHQGPAIPRVRSENPLLSVAIVQGAQRSTTFRRLIEAIDATDGLVYVLEGRCGQGVRACLHMSLELSGTNRLLRILVNPRRAPGCELIASIGHELQHALEALSNPNVRTSFGLSSFFQQIGPEGPRKFETPEAIQAGLAVDKEACRQDVSTRHVRATDSRILRLIDAGIEGSATFRSLVAILNESDVIVYVEPNLTRQALGGYLAHDIVAQGQYRYLRIAMEIAGSERRLVSLLAHELQHAVEVAQTPEARDSKSLERLFSSRAITFGCGSTTCSETQAAKDVEDVVKREFAP